MARPWICETCGTASNRDHCPNCLRSRPLPESNHPHGSFLGIYFGPGGWGSEGNPPRINWPVVAGALWMIGMFLIPVIMLGC